MRYVWKNPPLQEDRLLQAYVRQGIHPYVAQILFYRGILPEEAASFFHFSVKDLYDPFLFSHMEKVVGRLRAAQADKEKITIYGDYDCDGVCGAAILKETLRQTGIDADVYLPDRFTEGYGTNRAAFRKIIAGGTTLILTVDCGIKSTEDVAFARENGADVMIFDHHECETLPDTPYILNPKVPAEKYPFKELSGAGIAFKIAQALLGRQALPFLQLAGVATIGDMVSLKGENRTIAALGIEQIRKSLLSGLKSLAEAAGIDSAKVDSERIGFSIVPRLNAAGRLAHADLALQLLLSKDPAECAPLAAELNRLNAQRQAMQKQATQEAAEMIRSSKNLSKTRILLVYSKAWNRGVVGLVASSLTKIFHRPAIVFTEQEGVLIGSARSIAGVNLYQVLLTCGQRYLRFGGHEMAAGLSVKKEEIEGIEEELNRFLLENYEDELFLPTVYYDLAVEQKEISTGLAKQFAALQPFGQDNEEPLLFVKSFMPAKVLKMREGMHLKLYGEKGVEAIWFYASSEVYCGENYHVSANLSVNAFRGKESGQLYVRTIEKQTGGGKQIQEKKTKDYIRGFPRELLAYYTFVRENGKEKVITEQAELLRKLHADGQRGAFGTAVFIGSMPGAELAGRLDGQGVFTQFTAMETLNPNSAENMVCYSLPDVFPRNYDNVYLLGSFRRAVDWKNAHVFLSESFRDAYREEAKAYFVPEEVLPQYGQVFEEIGGKGYLSLGAFLLEVCRRTGDADIRKSWFALNVFAERKLLQIKKNAKIYIVCRHIEKWEESRLYDVFRAVCYREV